MKRFHFLAVATLIAMTFISCKKDNPQGSSAPEPGTTKTITVNLTYVSGVIEGTNPPSPATWPVAVFPVDAYAVKYKVHFYNFTGTFATAPAGYTYTWNKGELPQTPYNVYPSSKDIKDGKYYVAVGRTWCAGCATADPQWLVNYKTGYGTAVKADITFTY